MLVLRRMVDETVLIPDLGIKIMVIGIKGNQVSLGFDAPDDIKIYRDDLWERMQKDQTSNNESQS